MTTAAFTAQGKVPHQCVSAARLALHVSQDRISGSSLHSTPYMGITPLARMYASGNKSGRN
eukprot:1507069-Pleurochrysis_carterae.AAC.1